MLQRAAVASTALVLAVSGFASPAKPVQTASSERQALVGHWFGDDVQPSTGRPTKWLMDRRADGTFTVRFKEPAPSVVSLETGTRSGALYRTQTMSVNGVVTDPDDPYYYDEYLLEEVGADRIVYVHRKNQARYRSRRVGSDFRIP